MPTFTIPGSTATAAASTKKPSNRRKKPVTPEPEPEPESTTVSETSIVIDTIPEPEPEPEPESPVSEPTFPDIVILKQTEHNYIIKHNHYPTLSSSTSDGASMSASASASASASTALGHSNDVYNLVSPNQIHKGQISKKRGRKPKAGLILNSKGGMYDTTEVPNIILHLKCHLSDLKTNDSISNYDYTPAISEVESYMVQSTYLQPSDISTQKNNDEIDSDTSDNEFVAENTNIANEPTGSDSSYFIQNDASASAAASATAVASSSATTGASASAGVLSSTNHSHISTSVKKSCGNINDASIQIMNERMQKEIMKKIHRLKYSFHNGESIQTKMNHQSSCFWDTCEFEGPTYYIPIMIVNGVFQVNGCYCSPQCAVAALLKEPLDTSTKFERLHLLHLLYGTTNSKGFKPAPNPHYLLDKYYGNLTIQEYRALLKGPLMIHIVNKPLTHILPELYEDNNDFLVNSKVIPANSLKLKKKYKTMVVQSGAE